MEEKKMDVYERRKMFKEISNPNVSPETIEKYRKIQDERPVEENYGETLELTIDKISGKIGVMIEASRGAVKYDGQRVEAEFMNRRIPYFVTESWMNANMIHVDKAYRIFEEDENSMKVREVQNYSEKNRIADGIMEVIRKIVK
jgi:hypothetical protein